MSFQQVGEKWYALQRVDNTTLIGVEVDGRTVPKTEKKAPDTIRVDATTYIAKPEVVARLTA